MSGALPGLRARMRHITAQTLIVTVAVAMPALAFAPPAPVLAGTYTIVMSQFQFRPTPLRLPVGSTVVWSNRDITDHAVVPDDGGFVATGIIAPGHSRATKITKSGTINYHDGINSFMRGTLLVSSVAAATPRPTPRPTVRPTPRPTSAPTTKPTIKPTAKPTPQPSASPGGSANGSASPGTGAGAGTSAGPGGSAAPGTGTPAGSTGGSSRGLDPLLVVIAGLVLAGLALVAGAAMFTSWRSRPIPILPTASVVSASLNPPTQRGSAPAPDAAPPVEPEDPQL